MKATGIVRRIDDLGRVVIPKEIRRTLQIHEGDPLELFMQGRAVCFKKYDKTLSIRESVSDVRDLLKEEGVSERFSSEETKVIESVLSLITSRLKGEENEEEQV